METLFAVVFVLTIWGFVLISGWQGWRRHQEREGRRGTLRYDPRTDEWRSN